MGQFLNWLTSPDAGAFVLIAWAVAWGVEGIPWWDNLNAKAKQLIMLGLAIAIGLLAEFLQLHPEVVAAIDPYFKPVMYIVMFWLANQGAHSLDPKRLLKVIIDKFSKPTA